MSLSPPPPSTSDLCFSPVAFVSDTYSVDEFVSECRRHVTVEHLHQDLKSYYHTLKTAMIELINKDYSDFLDLSSNLVSVVIHRNYKNEICLFFVLGKTHCLMITIIIIIIIIIIIRLEWIKR